MSDEDLLVGDYACHGEEAYVFGEGTSAYVKGPLRGKELEGIAMGRRRGDHYGEESVCGGCGEREWEWDYRGWGDC